MIQYSNLFTPIKIGKVEIKNRFALAPMEPVIVSFYLLVIRKKVLYIRSLNSMFLKYIFWEMPEE